MKINRKKISVWTQNETLPQYELSKLAVVCIPVLQTWLLLYSLKLDALTVDRGGKESWSGDHAISVGNSTNLDCFL